MGEKAATWGDFPLPALSTYLEWVGLFLEMPLSFLVSQQAQMRRGREKLCLWFSLVAAQHLLQIQNQHIFTGKIPLAMKSRSPRRWRQLQRALNLVAHEIVGGTIALAASQTALDQMLAKREHAACWGRRRGASGISELRRYLFLVTPRESQTGWEWLTRSPHAPIFCWTSVK